MQAGSESDGNPLLHDGAVETERVSPGAWIDVLDHTTGSGIGGEILPAYWR